MAADLVASPWMVSSQNRLHFAGRLLGDVQIGQVAENLLVAGGVREVFTIVPGCRGILAERFQGAVVGRPAPQDALNDCNDSEACNKGAAIDPVFLSQIPHVIYLAVLLPEP